MNYQPPVQFSDVTATCKANIYFDGKVVSHVIDLADGSRKTLGLIYPGRYRFETGVPEIMEIIAGSCLVQIAGQGEWQKFPAGTFFEVPGQSSFTIVVDEGIAEYVCSYK